MQTSQRSYLLEQAVANYIQAEANDLVVTRPRDQQWPDFVLKTSVDSHLLIEVKAKAPETAVMQQMAMRLQGDQPSGAKFLLVTPDAPDAAEVARFQKYFLGANLPTEWIGVKELPRRLGRKSPGNWDSNRTLASLQTKALVKGLDQYAGAPIGPEGKAKSRPSSNEIALARQLPYSLIRDILADPVGLDSRLCFGNKRPNVTVVLSDLVNFSNIVSVSQSEDLRERMAEYYRKARAAVFEHDGMLDKFIGDAVLAVFGYPRASSNAAVNAIRFATSLTEIGRDVLGEWQQLLNTTVQTGTRIGLATGEIWPLNIGDSTVEITLLGDTINLAARLEKTSPTDGLRMDNRTHTLASRADQAYIDALKLKSDTLPASDLKGQMNPIDTWLLPARIRH
jgi:adenylate cyclase